ncbi:MAG: hypothetical protein HDKAJFGB_02723 [Anaerolineae bacterium]|nr:hypothetical protein [Anaerolineae bacterium]
MKYRLVTSLPDALIVRKLRNGCAKFMTNYSAQIGVWQQIRWYWKKYRREQRAGIFRVYLFWDEKQNPVGYGALQLHDDQLLVTECVKGIWRGRGYGRAILSALIQIAQVERRTLAADIFATNQASIALHEHLGFQMVSTRVENNRELRTYILATNADRDT